VVPSDTVNFWIAVTDEDWFNFLRDRPDLPEVNFWQPGGRTTFKALRPGELFLFKLHYPQNFIVGGGIFTHDSRYPVSLAWEAFGPANGASSLDEMRSRIRKYRSEKRSGAVDFLIGCRIISQPFFLPRDQWIPAPSSWSRHIVQGKTFRTNNQEGLHLWNEIQSRFSLSQESVVMESRPRYGSPSLIPPRLGQGGFRIVVADAYERRCALTGENVLPALEAAHIRPYAKGGEHSVENGLLLRKDFHGLFDRGYITVTSNYQLEVTKKIKEQFVNGKRYYELHGQRIRTPKVRDSRPSIEMLRWHNENVFIG